MTEPLIDGIPISSLPPTPSRLPVPSELPTPPPKPNLWNILRDAIGKDLTRIAIPVFFNEPISFLQRLAEDIEYYSLLDRAAHPSLNNTSLRSALVAAFVISHYSSTHLRAAKPFNPLLGETFELVVPEKNIAFIAEQVQHHPPVSAVFVQGNGWSYHTAHEIKNRFLPNSLEVWPEGTVHIRFANGEHYVYEQAHTFVHSIILGNIWLDNSGVITIREVTNKKFTASIKLKRNSFLFKEAKKLGDVSARVVRGPTFSKTAKPVHIMSGNWTSHLMLDGETVWKATPRPGRPLTAGYFMTSWVWSMNPEVLSRSHGLAKTDSRFRPDQRALEKGMHKIASLEKERLENAQRRRKRENDARKITHTPKWFAKQLDPQTGKREWRYKGMYFTEKLKKVENWPVDAPDIFRTEERSS